jgi:probable rRNA maturation factor
MRVRLTAPPERVHVPHLELPLLKQRAGAILRMLEQAKSELSIALVGDREIRELNRSYRKRDRATDVLSFSLVDGEWAGFRGELLGDVVISVETAARQARSRHRSLNEETARLLIHGVLHLLGHDHELPGERRRMRAEERRLSAVLRS